jgi:hypothetical protein
MHVNSSSRGYAPNDFLALPSAAIRKTEVDVCPMFG